MHASNRGKELSVALHQRKHLVRLSSRCGAALSTKRASLRRLRGSKSQSVSYMFGLLDQEEKTNATQRGKKQRREEAHLQKHGVLEEEKSKAEQRREGKETLDERHTSSSVGSLRRFPLVRGE